MVDTKKKNAKKQGKQMEHAVAKKEIVPATASSVESVTSEMETADMLSINEGMSEQLKKMEIDKVESAKHTDETSEQQQPLKVLVESNTEKGAVEHLAETIGATVVTADQEDNNDMAETSNDKKKQKKKEKKSPRNSQELKMEEFEEVDVKGAVKEAQRNVEHAKEQLNELESSLTEPQKELLHQERIHHHEEEEVARNEHAMMQQQQQQPHQPSVAIPIHQASASTSRHVEQEPMQQPEPRSEQSWLGEFVEDAKEVWTGAVDFVKGFLGQETSEEVRNNNNNNNNSNRAPQQMQQQPRPPTTQAPNDNTNRVEEEP